MGAVVINDLTKSVVKQIRGLTADGLTEFVEIATELAKDGSPYATGNNRDLVGFSLDKKNLRANIHSKSGYGAHLELGTSRMPARPYFAPAIGATVQEFNDGKKWGR